MKALLISDIHSNAEGLRAIWAAEGADGMPIYAAGDFVDYGTQPEEAVTWARTHGVQGVAGNHDLAVLDLWRGQAFREVPDGELRWAQHNCR